MKKKMGDLSLIAGLIYIILTICVSQSLFALDEYTMVETEPKPAIADTTGTADFSAEVVDKLGGNYGTELYFGTIEVSYPINGWLGSKVSDDDPTPTLIKISFLFGQGERGIRIYTDRPAPDNIRGLVCEDNGGNIPICWRVLNDCMDSGDFPSEDEHGWVKAAYYTVINEMDIESSVCQILLSTGYIPNPQVDLDGDGNYNEPGVCIDIDGDGLIESSVGILSNDPQAYLDEIYIARLNNEDDSDDHSTGVYECYLHLIDFDEIQLYSPPADPNLPDYSSATYATVVDAVYGIQHAAHTFDKWTDKTVYVHVAGDFEKSFFLGTYTATIIIETYSL